MTIPATNQSVPDLAQRVAEQLEQLESIRSAFANTTPGVLRIPQADGSVVYSATPESPPTSSAIRIIHRQPNAAATDQRAPRMVDLDEFMAIQPSALERAFFGFFDMEESKPYEMDGSVAVVAIDGPLMQRGGWWYDGYESIRGRFEKALEDKAVSAVVLKINSPGGVCAGCFSAARRMQAAKAEAGKPVIAYADESAYSAAYAMACIADEIYLPREGGVGSVGVIGVLEDWTAYNEKVGIKVAVITSGEYKADGHPDVPLSKSVIARYQARINQLAGSFAELVGDARGMSPSAVLKLEAACLYGEQAVKAGLANSVATFEEVVDKAQKKGASSKTRARSTIGSVGAAKGTSTMTIKKADGQENAEASTMGNSETSYADFALAVGLPHDASKGDILGAVVNARADAKAFASALGLPEASRPADVIVGAKRFLEAFGAKSIDEAIGRFTGSQATVAQFVQAITGDEKASVQDALAKLEAERKANETAKAKSLIEKAAAEGKTAGPKALELFEKHGMAALEAHLDALVPHAALVASPPEQKKEPGGTKPADASKDADGEIVVKLTEDDKRACERYGISEEAFIAARKDEIRTARENARKRDS